jgi:SAM-dependent methyltransferase
MLSSGLERGDKNKKTLFMHSDSKLGAANSSDAANSPRFRQVFAELWRDAIQERGRLHTLAQLASAFVQTLLGSLPSRRRSRFDDLDYDFDHAVDTTRSNLSFATRLLTAFADAPYFATEPWLFEQIMQALPIRFEDFVFVDIGSGKGRALLMAARHGFRNIIGVEFMPELHRAAEENIRKFGTSHPQAPQIQSACMNARDFQFPSGPLVVYLFNPFPEPVFAAVLSNLRESWRANSRPVFIAYRYPESERLLAESDWLEKIAGAEQWVVYQNRVIGGG